MLPFSYQQVRTLFNYDPITGWLTWRVRPSNGTYAGTRAGTNAYSGKGQTTPHCRQVKIYGELYIEAHIIWLWVTGKAPRHEVDHIDTDPFNNVWTNLREADDSQNNYNRHGHKAGCLKWAWYDKRKNKYQSRVVANGVKYWIGYFNTEQEAHDAAFVVAQRLHNKFVRKA
jgi:hypothetical protein